LDYPCCSYSLATKHNQKTRTASQKGINYMNIGVTDRLRPLLDAVKKFIDERVLPVEEEFLAEIAAGL
jgi:hypothetical protein